MAKPSLYWLPHPKDFRTAAKSLKSARLPSAWAQATAIANHNLDFVQTNMLDQIVQSLGALAGPIKTIRLAILASCTVRHLHPALRIAALRRGMNLLIYEAEYGQYRQELMDPGSPLHEFAPDTILFAYDAHHIARGLHPHMTETEAAEVLHTAMAGITSCWSLAKAAFKCTILQQTILPSLPDLLGSNEHRLPGAPASFIGRVNFALRAAADAEGAHLIAIDRYAGKDGILAWHDPANWHRSKQDITLAAAPLYGDLVVRVIAALAGRTAKCLVLDLDNTIWGGVIGDDGMDGIVLGQGSTEGEAFASFQRYAAALSARGIILAVCSKNDHAVAMQAFAEHPEMVLKPAQIAQFTANWNDKATNIRHIAAALNIGLDAMVFADDNPFERSLVRTELPMVAVPELPEDPALAASCLANAGYFEAVTITEEDRGRTAQYQVQQARAALLGEATDMNSYLRNLEMRLQWRPFDRIGLQRTVQLINKTNQFNLTTQRYTEDDVVAVMEDEHAFGIQLRLLDRFGDNGIIAVLIGHLRGADVVLDCWLMSCRVLGRQVEAATLAVAVSEAKRLGGAKLIGYYRPTPKNSMVKNHYSNLGFAPLPDFEDGKAYALPLQTFAPAPNFITIERT